MPAKIEIQAVIKFFAPRHVVEELLSPHLHTYISPIKESRQEPLTEKKNLTYRHEHFFRPSSSLPSILIPVATGKKQPPSSSSIPFPADSRTATTTIQQGLSDKTSLTEAVSSSTAAGIHLAATTFARISGGLWLLALR